MSENGKEQSCSREECLKNENENGAVVADAVAATNGNDAIGAVVATNGAIGAVVATNGATKALTIATPEMSAWIPAEAPLHPDCAVVMVDTETTGLMPTDQIVQLAATCKDKQFNVFMMPTVPIHPRASGISGLHTSEGNLTYRGEVVDTIPSEKAAESFLKFLRSCGPQVLIVGHNMIRFDAPKIVNWLRLHNLHKELQDLVYGFVCTIPLLQQGKIRKLEELAKKYLTSPEWVERITNAHNAEIDCLILEGLLNHFSISQERLESSAVTLQNFYSNLAKKWYANKL